jgi:DNA-binding response OmpR family regulator
MQPNKIIIVDDDSMVLALEVAYCSRLFPRAEIFQAENGKTAHDQIASEKPDLVISDVDMPVMGGVDLLKLVKEEFPSVKVFLLSGKMTDNLKFIASELGADATLCKPFTFSEFESVLKNL